MPELDFQRVKTSATTTIGTYPPLPAVPTVVSARATQPGQNTADAFGAATLDSLSAVLSAAAKAGDVSLALNSQAGSPLVVSDSTNTVGAAVGALGETALNPSARYAVAVTIRGDATLIIADGSKATKNIAANLAPGTVVGVGSFNLSSTLLDDNVFQYQISITFSNASLGNGTITATAQTSGGAIALSNVVVTGGSGAFSLTTSGLTLRVTVNVASIQSGGVLTSTLSDAGTCAPFKSLAAFRQIVVAATITPGALAITSSTETDDGDAAGGALWSITPALQSDGGFVAIVKAAAGASPTWTAVGTITPIAPPTFVRGRLYLLQPADNTEPFFIEAAHDGALTTLPLVLPLPKAVGVGSTITGVFISVDVTTTELIGEGLVEWQATILGRPTRWSTHFRVSRRNATYRLSGADVQRLSPYAVARKPADDPDFSKTIAAAWELIVDPILAANGLRSERIIDWVPLTPVHIAAVEFQIACSVERDPAVRGQKEAAISKAWERAAKSTNFWLGWEEDKPAPTAPEAPRYWAVTPVER